MTIMRSQPLSAQNLCSTCDERRAGNTNLRTISRHSCEAEARNVLEEKQTSAALLHARVSLVRIRSMSSTGSRRNVGKTTGNPATFHVMIRPTRHVQSNEAFAKSAAETWLRRKVVKGNGCSSNGSQLSNLKASGAQLSSCVTSDEQKCGLRRDAYVFDIAQLQ